MRSLLLLAAASCAVPNDDVVGPFTGPVHRYVVDGFTLPASPDDARRLADDLDGDGSADNQLGSVIATLAGQADTTTHAADMIASGVLASSVEIQADDLGDDPTVAVSYVGADGDPATPVGGTLVAGVFHGNRSRTTRVPGAATIRVPVFADADPVEVAIEGLELDLTSDGRGGFDAVVRGGIAADDVMRAASSRILAMLAANPADHLLFERLLDDNGDGIVTADEIAASSLIRSLLAPDIKLFDGGDYAPEPYPAVADSISLGFAVHLSPCETGRCTTAAPVDRCHDRARDGDETDIDCGGSCGGCPAAASCAIGADCQTGACDAGACRASSCGDGVRDGFESDVDCGGGCGGCGRGGGCLIDDDCASGHCNGTFTTGTCS